MTTASALLKGLNDTQQEAVLHDGTPLLILAGAGSGKTRVLTHKIAHLIHDRGVPPHHILAVTFTNKAAGEMKHRMATLLGENDNVLRDLWIGTFHSIGLRIVRYHAPKLGFAGDLVVYDSHDQLDVVKSCLKNLGWDKKNISPSAIAHFINRVKCDGNRNEPVGGSYFEKQALEVYKLYQTHLHQNQALDFSDLLIKPLELFERHPAILSYYQDRLRYIFVDEYQDTNRVQYDTLKALAGDRAELCVVGDEDQSIYKFRGADIQNILEFKKDFPNATIIRLEQNYRSTQNILYAANGVVQQNAQRLGKTLWSENSPGDPITIYTASDDRDEAAYVASEVQALASRISLDQIAIFYRTNAQSRVFEEACRRANIPYRIYGGLNFFERKEIKDLIAYLRILVNPRDSVSFRRIVNMPPRGIGPTSLETLDQLSAQHGIALLETLSRHSHLMSPRARAPFERFLALYGRLYEKMTTKPRLTELVQYILSETGYEKMLKDEASFEANNRLENIDEFLNAIADYEDRTTSPTLSGFLEQITLDSTRNTDTGEIIEKPLTLMTLHLAKGLEFPYVFLVGLEENLLPHTRSLENPDDLEEERRLMYVGMTRAMKRLYLTHAHRRYAHGREQMNMPSRFLAEVPRDVVQEIESPLLRTTHYDENYDNDTYDDDIPARRPASSEKSKTSYSISRPNRVVAAPSSSRPAASKKSDSAYRIGTLIRHPQFGKGVIRGLEGDSDALKITILFESGQMKKILGKYAQLEAL